MYRFFIPLLPHRIEQSTGSGFLRGYRRRAQAPASSLAQRSRAHSVATSVSARPVGLPLLGGLLLISGCATLIYQVLWIKQLGLLVGVDVYAVTIAISAFFAGLGGGSHLFGRTADRLRRPLLLYAALEFGIAATALFATFALPRSAQWFATSQQQIGPLAWALPFALIGIPALLMGGTLPALLRVRAPGHADIGRSGGALYSLNTAGALIGALLTPFVLIPRFGVFGAASVAATANVLLAAIALLSATAIGDSQPQSAQRNATAVRRNYRALIVYAIAGGLALGYEVVWSQAAIQLMSTRSFAFAIVLATYLAGLMLGSALYARHADRVREPWGAFGVLIAGAGVLALLQIGLLGDWLPQLQTWSAQRVAALTDNALAAMLARFAIVAFSMILAPTLLLGAAFPLALRLVAADGHIGRDTGNVLAFNTLGGIVGTLGAGFVLLPSLGLVHTSIVLAASALLLAWYATSSGPGWRQGNARFVLTIMSAALAVGIAMTPPQRFAELLTAVHPGRLVFHAENPGGTVAVIEQPAARDSFHRLYIQGVSNSGDAMPSLRYMRLQALLPLLIQREEPRSALVVALGTGITAGALTQYPTLEQRVCVELLPAVVDAAALFNGNYDVTRDPRVDIRVRDGRRELLANAQRYDLITLEPPPPSAAGVANLYSSDFYRIASARLNDGGLFAQWLPLATQNDEDSRALVRSFLDVFPHATLWTTELHEMLLVGSQQPIELDGAQIARRFAQPQVAGALREAGIASPAALLATWMMDRDGLERYAGDALPVTDDDPRIEYAPWLRRGEFARVLPQLLALRSAPPLRNAGAALRSAVDAERAQLFDFYDAALNAYRGDRAGWTNALNRLPDAATQNPYYRWIAGG